MSDAPVCHIPPDVANVDPATPRLPPIPTPTHDLNSIIQAILALKMGYEMLAGMRSNMAPRTGPGGISGFKTNRGASKQGRWNQVIRQLETVRVFNPTDPTQFVDVRRVKRLVMQDNVTGEQWIYNQ